MEMEIQTIKVAVKEIMIKILRIQIYEIRSTTLRIDSTQK
jgi:hypothetical protein